MIWKGIWLESLNGCERRASDGLILGNFQLEPNSEIWKVFGQEMLNGPQLGDLGGDLVRKSEWV